ncbi:hypothetical protein NL355_29460, partial [Klebsiella pneumoniae]|nr:hypothetical protein [Klebsiella pneumoniae]
TYDPLNVSPRQKSPVILIRVIHPAYALLPQLKAISAANSFIGVIKATGPTSLKSAIKKPDGQHADNVASQKNGYHL